MHNVRSVTDDLVYIGVSERRIELFENVYPIPRGVSYNSYLLLDEKTVLMDTVDRCASGQFMENLDYALNGRDLDYLVVQHMEPDHCATIPDVIARYPGVKIVCSKLAMDMMKQFFDMDVSSITQVVAEGDTLSTGRHTLAFVEAPMVHWPEVLMTYDTADGMLFSADAFGTFGALNGNLFADEVNFETEWLPDARRYYTNIVGKYGPQVQAVLQKAATLDIRMICPLHGPVWRDNFGWILDKYTRWSTYTPEDDAVAVFYGSIYGGTENAANLLASRLSQGGLRNVVVYDVSKTHVSELIAEAFRCSHLVFASVTYNMGLFTPMKNFMNDLIDHNLQNRSVALVENGSWSPVAGRVMGEMIARMPDMRTIGKTVTLLSSTNAESMEQLHALADEIALDMSGDPAPAQETSASASATAWRCTVCGYIYEGEALPDGYVCPLCGVGVDKFERVV
ncbi:MAG: MBL fold metallo-hydrolase [Clostridia bacterium]|nr:MBL fold metallo-hydrolase [Clostridia bacterium]